MEREQKRKKAKRKKEKDQQEQQVLEQQKNKWKNFAQQKVDAQAVLNFHSITFAPVL